MTIKQAVRIYKALNKELKDIEEMERHLGSRTNDVTISSFECMYFGTLLIRRKHEIENKLAEEFCATPEEDVNERKTGSESSSEEN